MVDLGRAIARDVAWRDSIMPGSTEDVLIWKGRASVWATNPAPILDVSSVRSVPVPGARGRRIGTVKKKKTEKSWREQVLHGTLPQIIPWDDAASLPGVFFRKSQVHLSSLKGHPNQKLFNDPATPLCFFC